MNQQIEDIIAWKKAKILTISNKDFRNFLYISKGSCGEVRSMLALALELRYIKYTDYKLLKDQAVEISKILSGFIKALN